MSLHGLAEWRYVFLTWEKEGQLRLQGHLSLKSDATQNRCEDQARLSFMSVGPHVRGSLWGRNCSRCHWAGAYYILAPKFGAVFRGGSVRRFHDVPVNPDWVFNIIEGGKIRTRMLVLSWSLVARVCVVALLIWIVGIATRQRC